MQTGLARVCNVLARFALDVKAVHVAMNAASPAVHSDDWLETEGSSMFEAVVEIASRIGPIPEVVWNLEPGCVDYFEFGECFEPEYVEDLGPEQHSEPNGLEDIEEGPVHGLAQDPALDPPACAQ